MTTHVVHWLTIAGGGHAVRPCNLAAILTIIAIIIAFFIIDIDTNITTIIVIIIIIRPEELAWTCISTVSMHVQICSVCRRQIPRQVPATALT